MKSGNLKFLEPSGPLQACNGTAFSIKVLWSMAGYVVSNISWHILTSTRRLIWKHERNTIKLHVQVFLRMNAWLFETCRRHYNLIKTLMTENVHFVVPYYISMCSFRLMSFVIRASDWWNEEKCLFTARNFRTYGILVGGFKKSICSEKCVLPGCYAASSDNSLPLVMKRQPKLFNNISTSRCETVTFLTENIVENVLTGAT